jgi:ADP-ribosylglycohydrolase/fructose-1,6-bisphosphatase/inositol monophosphatase family enzyme
MPDEHDQNRVRLRAALESSQVLGESIFLGAWQAGGKPYRPYTAGARYFFGSRDEDGKLLSRLWIRPSRNLDRNGVVRYALTFDGYAFAEAVGFNLFQAGGEALRGGLLAATLLQTFLDLRCFLFCFQRSIRDGDGGIGEDFDLFYLNQLVCDAWDRETGGVVHSPPRYHAELRTAIAAAQVAAALSRRNFYSGKAHETDKQADEEIRQLLLKAFPEYGYRGEEVGLTDEPRDDDGHLWLVDPQDGTTAASQGFRSAAVSIALLREGLLVLGVVLAYAAPDSAGDLFFWAEGMDSVYRNNEPVKRHWPAKVTNETIVFLSQKADDMAEVNASLVAPARYRCIPGIAYRLALVAAGEGDLGISSNSPTGWDIAGGHALLLGAGGDVFDKVGKRITYDRLGTPHNRDTSRCFGGTSDLVTPIIGRSWEDIWKKQRSAAKASSSLSFLRPGKTISDPNLLSRAQGCLLGQIAGDSLGSLVEFQSASEIARKYPTGPSRLADGGTFSTLAGQPTDDSEMALALARSIVRKGIYDRDDAANCYAQWLASGPFDVGTTTSTALSAALAALQGKGSAAQAALAAANRTSQANGALMRVSPLGIYGHARSAEETMALASADAELTHPNQVCRDASAIFAATVAFALQSGAGAQITYQFATDLASSCKVSEPVQSRLTAAVKAPPHEFEGGKMGWVLVAFQNAFYQLLHANSLEDAIISTVRFGGDTDTNAAISGALLGAVHGRDAIPEQWRSQIQSCRPIQGLAGVKRPRPAIFWPVDVLNLAENLLLAGSEAK